MRLKYPLIVLVVAIPFGAMAGGIFSETDSAALSIAKGAATGLLLGVIAAVYVWWRDGSWARWGKRIRSRLAGEGVVHDGQARIGASLGVQAVLSLVPYARHAVHGVDGWLVVTQRHVVFQPRYVGKASAIPIEKIAGARYGTSPIPNTIELGLHDQTRIEIRVQDRDEWLARLATIPSLVVERAT